MAWSKSETTVYGKVINYTYLPATLFSKAQQLSQYHASANKDKAGNEAIDIAFSSDYQDYFDSFCKKAVEDIGNNFIQVNVRNLNPYVYTRAALTQNAGLAITDHGFVKDSLLSVLDEVIEKAIVDYVLYKWYEHLGVEELKKKYAGLVAEATITIRGYLWQFLRKVYPVIWYPLMSWTDELCVQAGYTDFTMKWSEEICVQESNFTVTVKWTDDVCQQEVTNEYSLNWSDPVCVQDLYMKDIKWTNPVCVQQGNFTSTIKWTDEMCVQDVFSIFTIEWSDELCVQYIEGGSRI